MSQYVPASRLMPTQTQNRRTWLLATGASAVAIAGGYAAALYPVLLVVPLAVACIVVLCIRPAWAILGVIAAATSVEQFSYSIGTRAGPLTSRIPFFRAPAHGMIISPIEVFILVALLMWIMYSGARHSFGLARSPVAACMLVFWFFLVVGMGMGLSHGAQLRDALWELRPWILFSATYLLAWAMLRTRRTLNALLWTLVICTGFKAFQGVYLFLAYARNMTPRPETILGHEEAFFFCIFVTLTVALWLYNERGPLRTTATALLPIVLLADLANARRVAWLLLIASLIVLLVIVHSTVPSRRRVVRRVFAVLLVGSAIYLPLYWNHGGTIAQPARAIRSAIAPDARDESSDLYRKQENVNLILNIKSAGQLGRGFGVPIDYSVTIANIRATDPMIAFIPHNGVLWIWLRLGILGEMAFWCLVMAALIRACRLARARDRRLGMFGAFTASAIVAYALMGYNDLGFAWFRIAVVMGSLLGAMEAAHRLALDAGRKRKKVVTEPVPGPSSESALALVPASDNA